MCNVDARPLSAADARAHLASQVVSPVLFKQSVHWLSEQGVDTFVECGFGGVLTKLVKRIEPAAARFAPVSPEEIAQVATIIAHRTVFPVDKVHAIGSHEHIGPVEVVVTHHGSRVLIRQLG